MFEILYLFPHHNFWVFSHIFLENTASQMCEEEGGASSEKARATTEKGD